MFLFVGKAFGKAVAGSHGANEAECFEAPGVDKGAGMLERESCSTSALPAFGTTAGYCGAARRRARAKKEEQPPKEVEPDSVVHRISCIRSERSSLSRRPTRPEGT